MKNGLRLPFLVAGLASLLVLSPVFAAPPKANPVPKAGTRKQRQNQPVLPKPRLVVRLPDAQGSGATSNAATLERARLSGRLNLGSGVTFVGASPYRLFFLGAGTQDTTDLESLERATGALQWRQNVSDQSVTRPKPDDKRAVATSRRQPSRQKRYGDGCYPANRAHQCTNGESRQPVADFHGMDALRL